MVKKSLEAWEEAYKGQPEKLERWSIKWGHPMADERIPFIESCTYKWLLNLPGVSTR